MPVRLYSSTRVEALPQVGLLPRLLLPDVVLNCFVYALRTHCVLSKPVSLATADGARSRHELCSVSAGLISFVGTTATDLEVGMKSWGGAAAARAVLHGRAPGLLLMRTSPSGWVTAKFDAEDGFTFRFRFEFNPATPDVELHFLTRLRNDTNVLPYPLYKKSWPENPKRRPTQDLRRVLLQLSLDNFPVPADRAFVHAVLPHFR